MSADYSLARFGHFYSGGRRLSITGQSYREITLTPSLPRFRYDPNGTYAIEQAYVEYFVPANAIQLPWVLIHGGTLTGSTWGTTPDGRDGWIHYLLQNRRTVYVVDTVERGRAGWCSLPGVWQGDPLMRSEEEAWWLYRFGLAENYPTREPFEGLRFPVQSLPNLMRASVPQWRTNRDATLAALRETVRSIGPCVLMTHSSGGSYGFDLAQLEPERVRAVVSVEPSSFPGSVTDSINGKPFLTILGDNIQHVPTWVDLERKTEALCVQLAEKRSRVELVRLAEHDMPNHSHMMMMDFGNDDILYWVLEWVDTHLGLFVGRSATFP